MTFANLAGKEEILIAELCPFVKCHPQLSYLGLVLTDICKEEMFTDLSHEDFNQALGINYSQCRSSDLLTFIFQRCPASGVRSRLSRLSTDIWPGLSTSRRLSCITISRRMRMSMSRFQELI